MPEVGLVPFARVALDVARAALPLYRAPHSKHVFAQPQRAPGCTREMQCRRALILGLAYDLHRLKRYPRTAA